MRSPCDTNSSRSHCLTVGTYLPCLKACLKRSVTVKLSIIFLSSRSHLFQSLIRTRKESILKNPLRHFADHSQFKLSSLLLPTLFPFPPSCASTRRCRRPSRGWTGRRQSRRSRSRPGGSGGCPRKGLRRRTHRWSPGRQGWVLL